MTLGRFKAVALHPMVLSLGLKDLKFFMNEVVDYSI